MKRNLLAAVLFGCLTGFASCEKEAEIKPDLQLQKTMEGDKNNCGTWDLRQTERNP